MNLSKQMIAILTAIVLMTSYATTMADDVYFVAPFDGNLSTQPSVATKFKRESPASDSTPANQPQFVDGLFGKAIYIGSQARNLLSSPQSEGHLVNGAFKALGNAVLTQGKNGWKSGESVSVRTNSGPLSGVMTTPISLTNESGSSAAYAASLYLRGKGSVRVFVENLDHHITYEPQYINLNSKWQRVVCPFPLAAPSSKVVIKCVAGSDKAVDFDVDALQIEQSIGDAIGWASPWIPGGVERKADSLQMTFPPNFPVKEGTIWFWFRPSWTGIRGNTQRIFLDHTTSQLQLLFEANNPVTYLGLNAKGQPALAGVNWALNKKRAWPANTWHLWAATWKDGAVSCYLDGQLMSRLEGPIHLKDPSGQTFSLGGDRQNRTSRKADAAIDQLSILHRAWELKDVQSAYNEGMKLSGQANVASGPRALVPTPEIAAKLKNWKQRGLKLDDVYVAILPSSSTRMIFPLYGRWVAEAPSDNAAKAINFNVPLRSYAGRFAGTAAWDFRSGGGAMKFVTGNGPLICRSMDTYTISTWMVLADQFQKGPIFAQGGSVGGFGLKLEHGKIVGYQTNKSKVQSVKFDLAKKDLGRWINVAYVFNGKAGKQSLFLNGILVAESKTTFDHAVIGKLGWRVGRERRVDDTGLDGLVDEVLIWDRGLSASELAEQYRLGKPDASAPKMTAVKVAEQKVKAASVPESGFARDDIYLYVSFDKTIQPDIEDSRSMGLLRGRADKVNRQERKIIDRSKDALVASGRFGKAVSIGGVDDNAYRDSLSYHIMDWPSRDATIAFWFKPSWTLKDHKGSSWLWYINWCAFMSGAEGKRMNVVIGNNKDNKIVFAFTPHGAKAPMISADKWYHYAATWTDDGGVKLYLDGKLYASMQGAVTRKMHPGNDIYFGTDSLIRSFSRLKAKGDAARAPDTLDELLILRRALSAEQVARLASQETPIFESCPDVSFTDVRTAFRRDENITIPLNCIGGDKVSATLIQGKRQWPLGIKSTTKKTEFTIEPLSLSTGKYVMEVVLYKAGKVMAQSKREIIIHSEEQLPISMGLYGNNLNPNDSVFSDGVREGGWRYCQVGGINFATFAKQIDDYYRNNIVQIPALHVDFERDLIIQGYKVEEYGQKSLKGKWIKSISTSSPLGQEKKRNDIRKALAAVKGNPNLRLLSFWDEYELTTDVSDHAIAAFKKATGLSAPPVFKPVKKGTIVDDKDPLAQWIDMFGAEHWIAPHLAESDRELTKLANSLVPGTQTVAMPSSGFGSTSVMVAEVYPYLIEKPLNPLWGKSELMCDTILEHYYSTVPDKRSKYPLWVLPGWLNYPGPDATRPSLNIMLEVAIAKGATGYMPAPASWFWSRPDMRKDVLRFNRFCDRFGAMLRSLDRRGIARLAVLWNEHNVMAGANGWRRGYSVPGNYYFPALRLAGTAPTVVREDEVKQGGLKKYDGILITETNVMTRGVLNGIEQFAAGGGKVFVPKKSAIVPKGAITINIGDVKNPWPLPRMNHPMGNKVRHDNSRGRVPLIRAEILSKLPPRGVSVDSSWLACYEARQGDNTFIFVINSDLYANHKGVVRMDRKFSAGYELTQGKSVNLFSDDSSVNWATQIEAGGWRVFLLTSQTPKKIALDWSIKNHRAMYSVKLADANGKPVAGGWPLYITLRNAGGKVEYQRSAVMTGPVLKGAFSLSRMTDLPGKWTLEIEDLASGLRQKKSQKYKK